VTPVLHHAGKATSFVWAVCAAAVVPRHKVLTGGEDGQSKTLL
jgi:hypothetical protein